MKQSKFVEAYKQLNNAPQAAISAGYSAKSAQIEGCRLLKHPGILLELDNWRRERSKEFKKEDFIDYALNDYKSLENTEPNKPRFLQLAGQAAGHIGTNDSRPNQTINLTQNKIEINSMPPSSKWDALRGLLESD